MSGKLSAKRRNGMGAERLEVAICAASADQNVLRHDCIQLDPDVTACETERTPPRACRKNAGAAPATARGLRLRRDPSSPRCGTRYPTNIYLQAPSDRCARSPCGRG